MGKTRACIYLKTAPIVLSHKIAKNVKRGTTPGKCSRVDANVKVACLLSHVPSIPFVRTSHTRRRRLLPAISSCGIGADYRRWRRMSALVTCCTDGYPDHDVQMRWRGNDTRQAVYGIDDINIPQFTVLNIRTATAAGTASLGNALFLFPPSRRQRLKILLFPCFPPKAKRRTFITVILYIRNCA